MNPRLVLHQPSLRSTANSPFATKPAIDMLYLCRLPLLPGHTLLLTATVATSELWFLPDLYQSCLDTYNYLNRYFLPEKLV